MLVDDTIKRENMVREMTQEASMLSGIKHPNIVKCHGLSLEGKNPVLFMEHVEGNNLYRFLHKENKRFRTFEQLMKALIETADAMQTVHAANVVHRDIKSHNIVYNPIEKTTKLLDFGLAREEHPEGHMTPRTGSYRWAAPEVLRGEVYFRSADVYSWGILAWEIITGGLPYELWDPQHAALKVAFEGYRPVRLKPSRQCPQALCDLVHSTWEEDPTARPSMAMVVDKLREIQAIYKMETPVEKTQEDGYASDEPPVCGLLRMFSSSKTRSPKS